MAVINAGRLFEDRVGAVKSFHRFINVGRAELDLSGGIDSAVMACILIEALGRENIVFVHTNINTSPDQTNRAEALCDALGVPLINLDLSEEFSELVQKCVTEYATSRGNDYASVRDSFTDVKTRIENDNTIIGSFRSCFRAPIGRFFNRLNGGGIRHGTGNECEDRWLRFYQKGGDGEVDTNPLAMLSKSEVYQLAWYIGREMNITEVMDRFIAATPSPDLWGDIQVSDEDELRAVTGVPFTYGRIDLKNGELINSGTIEMVSRFADISLPNDLAPKILDRHVERLLFGKATNEELGSILELAKVNAGLYFPGVDCVFPLLFAARRMELATRHKENPNIPKLGSRKQLVKISILSNEVK